MTLKSMLLTTLPSWYILYQMLVDPIEYYHIKITLTFRESGNWSKT